MFGIVQTSFSSSMPYSASASDAIFPYHRPSACNPVHITRNFFHHQLAVRVGPAMARQEGAHFVAFDQAA
jgi:hypothetical protein